MRAASFIIFIIGCILAFSEAATGLGIALMVIGVLLNWYYHLSKMAQNRKK